jgi:hypothetical protein
MPMITHLSAMLNCMHVYVHDSSDHKIDSSVGNQAITVDQVPFIFFGGGGGRVSFEFVNILAISTLFTAASGHEIENQVKSLVKKGIR